MAMTSEQPNIRETLFGDMPISAWIGLGQNHPGEPWSSFSRARDFLESGREQQAAEQLQGITQMDGVESRQVLQAWHFLRQLGVAPPQNGAKLVYGVVVEVGMEAGSDIVAAYADHSARYINYSGAAIIWEHPERSLDGMIDALLGAGASIIHRIGPWDGARPGAPASGEARISMLTPSGLHFGQAPYEALAADEMGSPILKAALDLMQALIERSKPASA
jgi:hypothetical protein